MAPTVRIALAIDGAQASALQALRGILGRKIGIGWKKAEWRQQSGQAVRSRYVAMSLNE